MRLLVTRPEPDASRQARELEALGLEALVEPLLSLTFAEDAVLDLEGVQALIATSRNGLRALERLEAVDAASGLPLIAVGPASAQTARKLGFKTVHEGPGTAEGLVEVVQANAAPEGGVLLHLAGASLASDLKGALETKGFAVRQPVLYRAEAREGLSEAARAAVGEGGLGGVILMSPRTAAVYGRLVSEAGLAEATGELLHFCLSKAVAARLEGAVKARVLVSARPREDDLLALVARETAH